jgi:predicted unusual protein kinase regulating ubiquinone biosynthesis (AarF/ABC1/UbiB family)
LVSSGLNSNPIREVFADVTPMRLFRSSWRVFWRIFRLQGLEGALRVIPIIWLVIKTVQGFSQFHANEYARLQQLRASGAELEEAVLTAEELEEYRVLGAWLREELHALGPTFIKIGQTLSTRADLVPLPALIELAKLQEEVQEFPSEVALATIERDLGSTPDKLFAEFDPQPIAAASLSQAYKAVLRDGRDVVVKVQRPQLTQLITRDVQTLGAIADEVMTYPNLCRHTDWPGVVEEFARTTFDEIDYIREGRNADRFRHNHRSNENIYIPRIIWRLTGRHVLTIEYVAGARVNDSATIEAMGLDREELTTIGANFYLKQLLEDGFFHADPHPGNMRIMADGRIGIFDFGMVGRISPELMHSMINAFMHVVKGEYRMLVDDFVDMGFLRADADRDLLAEELSPIVESRFAAGLNKVKFRELVFDFSDLVYRYPFRLPSEFTYIMRALLTLEGVALAIYPDFNFVEAAMPFAQRLVFKEAGSTVRAALLKEVFAEGKFQPQKAMSLLRSATRLTL